MVMPGDNVELNVELIHPIAMELGTKFSIREGEPLVQVLLANYQIIKLIYYYINPSRKWGFLYTLKCVILNNDGKNVASDDNYEIPSLWRE